MRSDPMDVKETKKPSVGPSLVVRDKAPTPVEPAKKKPYSTPKLVVYGTLSDLTRGNGNAGNLDNGVGPKQTH